jgi:hypothetical protein
MAPACFRKKKAIPFLLQILTFRFAVIIRVHFWTCQKGKKKERKKERKKGTLH